jgi:outer membrane immunogenic protein
MRFRRVSIIAVSTIALTQLASAADLSRKAPPAPIAPAPSWTGFYVGANVGYGWGDRDVTYRGNDPLTTPGVFPLGFPPTSFDASGVVGGVQLGYNWQFNRNWLVGVETDFSGSGVDGSGSSLGSGSGIGNGAFVMNADEHVKWFGTVRARLGYLPTDNLLVYATGGFAYGKVERTANLVNTSGISVGIAVPPFAFNCFTGTACYAGSSSHTATGWTAGGGIEYAFWSKWTVRAEYLYISLDDSTVTLPATSVPAGSATPSINANFGRTNLNIARVGVNYRF